MKNPLFTSLLQALLILFCALLSTLPVAASERENFHEYELNNGMEVVLIRQPENPAISHNILLRLGGADDPRGKSGLAHYLEHMMFQGTTHEAANMYSRKIAAVGGRTNAFTTKDATGYWVNISKANLPLVMALEADRLQHLYPELPDFQREKQVILEERHSRLENRPTALFAEQLAAQLYYHHPYGTPIIGWKKEMEALNREDVLKYYKRFYHPHNMVLVIAGDLDIAETKALIQQYYGPLNSKGEYPSQRTEEPPQRGLRHFTMSHPQAGEPLWQWRFLAPSYGWDRQGEASDNQMLHRQILGLLVAEHLLGGSKSSRLHQRLVEKEELATSVQVAYYPFQRGPAEFNVHVRPKHAADVPKIKAIIEEEFARLASTHPSEKDLKRAKTQLIASNIYLQDGLQPMARVVGLLKILKLPMDFYFDWEENIEAMRAEDVSASMKLLDQNYSVEGLLLPETTDPHLAAAAAE